MLGALRVFGWGGVGAIVRCVDGADLKLNSFRWIARHLKRRKPAWTCIQDFADHRRNLSDLVTSHCRPLLARGT